MDHSRIPPPPAQASPIFQGAVNVKKFGLYTHRSSLLSSFTFPNLTIFDFSMQATLFVSLLLNFIEASPSLQVIRISTGGYICHKDVHPDRVLFLPCVKEFLLVIPSDSSGWELATHLSCSSAVRAGKFGVLSTRSDHETPEDLCPPSGLWNTIIRQYMVGMIEEVVLQLEMIEGGFRCSIIFRSSDGNAILFLYVRPLGNDDDQDKKLVGEIDLFSQVSRIIGCPILADLRRLFILGGGVLAGELGLATNDIWKMLESIGPLEELELSDCDLRPYLDPFLETPLFPNSIQSTSFPSTKELRIVDPIHSFSDHEMYAAALVKFAKTQHGRGVPFERVTIRPPIPSWVVEELRLSVNTVVCDGIPSD